MILPSHTEIGKQTSGSFFTKYIQISREFCFCGSMWQLFIQFYPRLSKQYLWQLFFFTKWDEAIDREKRWVPACAFHFIKKWCQGSTGHFIIEQCHFIDIFFVFMECHFNHISPHTQIVFIKWKFFNRCILYKHGCPPHLIDTMI